MPRSVRWRLWSAYYRSDLVGELQRVADSSGRELAAQEWRITNGAAVLSWLLAAIALAPVGLLVIAMYMPMFSLLSKIG